MILDPVKLTIDASHHMCASFPVLDFLIQDLFILLYWVLCLHVCMHVYMYAVCMPGACREKKVLGPLAFIVIIIWVLGTNPGSSAR